MTEKQKPKVGIHLSEITKKRLNRFWSIPRGRISLLIIAALYALSFFSEWLINERALFVHFESKNYFTVYDTVELKRDIFKKAAQARNAYMKARNAYRKEESPRNKKLLEAAEGPYQYYRELKSDLRDFRQLARTIEENNKGNFVLLAPYPFGPTESSTGASTLDRPLSPPSTRHWLGTDDRGRDVLARLVYGFRISLTFALLLTLSSFIIGISFGALMGYYGGPVDFFGMRVIEIWSAVPFLYMVMIVSSMIVPDFPVLIILLAIFSWMGITWYVRAEFLREKPKEYVQAATAIGVSDPVIIFRHILPNSLTPIISFLPFAVVTGITALVSLDFLGFGLPEPTPSWGEMLRQGLSNLSNWWISLFPIIGMAATLIMITFIGEAFREAFDPKQYARLK